jgi:hypothetical protein
MLIVDFLQHLKPNLIVYIKGINVIFYLFIYLFLSMWFEILTNNSLSLKKLLISTLFSIG